MGSIEREDGCRVLEVKEGELLLDNGIEAGGMVGASAERTNLSALSLCGVQTSRRPFRALDTHHVYNPCDAYVHPSGIAQSVPK